MMIKKETLTAIAGTLFVLGCLSMNSCKKDNEESLRNNPNGEPPPTACDTVGMKYQANVLPILTANCYKCHSANTYRTNSGLNLEDFNTLKAEAANGALLSSIKHTGTVSPMPMGAPQLSECDINKIDSWIKRGALNN
ncbi:hypothetical protein J2T02_004411 [Chitinophaga terrae (ex Kim and Jung 2007)]|uniref:hypothetical protein n=1 Tax=Chitinophaga terrae (ex Kim and Jung 2007) TaxID=408074 RepID=UPI002789A263|nr:hypothetical protein [Chitinophaga terrae (ex Kim and Jung 2007)]MDQ0109268.1 hypothetical protein [Chitinophaga terrae (ex Kim and Jung 2007)]